MTIRRSSAVGDLDYVTTTTASSTGQYAAGFARLPPGVPNAYDLIGYDSPNQESGVVSAGVKRSVTANGSLLPNQDIALDHPFNQTVSVTADADSPFGGANLARLAFYTRGHHVFETQTTTKPFSVTSPLMDSAVSILERRLEVEAGLSVDFTDAQSYAQTDPAKFFGVTRLAVPTAAAAATATFPAPGAVTAPTLGTFAAPGISSAAGLTVSWTHDPSAAVVEVTVRPAVQGSTGYVYWTAYVPSSRGSFAFFPLPANVTPTAAFPTGKARIRLHQMSNATISKVSDLFASNNGAFGYVGNHATTETYHWGFVTLQ